MKVLFLFLLVTLLSACSKSPGHPNDIGAYVACQFFVKDYLKAPESADFEDITNTPVKRLKFSEDSEGKQTAHYLVAGYFTGINSFGARLKTAYACKTHKTTGGEWIEDFVQID